MFAAHEELNFGWVWCRKEGQDTTEELRKRNIRDELEDRERRHFSSKDRGYSAGSKREEEKLAIKNIDADDSDVDAQSSDQR